MEQSPASGLFLATTSGVERPPNDISRHGWQDFGFSRWFRQTKCMKLKVDSCTSWNVSEMFPYAKGWLFTDVSFGPILQDAPSTKPERNARCVRLAVSWLRCWAFCWCARGQPTGDFWIVETSLQLQHFPQGCHDIGTWRLGNGWPRMILRMTKITTKRVKRKILHKRKLPESVMVGG